MHRLIISVLFFLLTTPVIISQIDVLEVQTFLDSNSYRNFFSNYFTNDRLSSNLLSKLSVNIRKGRMNYYIKNYYSSNVSKLTTKLFRDYDNVKIGTGYYITENLNVSANYSGQLYNDEKNVKPEGTFSNYIYGSAFYENDIKGAAYYSKVNLGYKYDRQIGELNKGISTYGEFNVFSLNFNDYFFDGQMKLGYEDLNPRRNNLIYTRTYIEKSFQNDLARNEFEGSFSRIRKDFYFPADANTINVYGVTNNIEKRTEYITKGFDRLDYTISDNLGFYLTVNPYYRNIYKENAYIPFVTTSSPSIYDTQIQELMIAGDAALVYDNDKLSSQLKISYSERDEKHLLINEGRIPSVFVPDKRNLEATKNNHSTRVRLTGYLNYNMTQKNRFEFSGSSSILKYDTQSELNFDDRDELNFIVYLGHRYNNLRNLELLTSVDLNLYHTVYIFAQKSSNNNWNRVIRLTSRSTFQPSEAFRSINTFSVLANYTAYDFEDVLSSVKSFSFRQFNLKDSTQFLFTRHFGIDVYGELKLYERGELNWRGFSLRPITFYEDRIVNGYLSWFVNRDFVLSGGYRYFEQRRFNYLNGERIFDTFVRTLGPVAKIKALITDGSYIEAVGSYDYYRFPDATSNSSNGNVSVNIIWNF